MEFKEIVMSRYAAKSFSGEKIPEEKVNELLDLVRNSASSWNIQPWKIKIVRDEDTLKKLYAVSYNQKQITSCSHLLVFCAETDLGRHIDALEKLFTEKTGEKPTHMDMVRQDVLSRSKEEQECYAKTQVFLALGNALNGAKSLGFDSCPMGGFDAQKYSEILSLPKNLIPAVICPIGYASDTPREKIRFDRKDILA